VEVVKAMKIMMLGLRAFPEVQGGVETHAEHLCPLLVKLGYDVTVITRSAYQSEQIGAEWQGVKFKPLWAPKTKGLEAILHSFIGVLYAAIKRPDILHIQAIGPGLMTLLARLLGLRVVVTHHGPDYERQKWGRFARLVLRLGERFGMRWSNGRVAISKVITDLVRDKHGVESALIPNGVVLPQLPLSTVALNQFGLIPERYVLLVGRLVPEKRHLDLIDAFVKAAIPGWKLVIVGGSDHPDSYQTSLVNRAVMTPNVVMTGFQKGLALRELYAHAGLFVLPSSHEGLPIVMLEALSFGLPTIASGIPANLEVGLSQEHYFPLGDIDTLATKLKERVLNPIGPGEREFVRQWVVGRYNWQRIAENTAQLYKDVMDDKPHSVMKSHSVIKVTNQDTKLMGQFE